KERVVEEEHQRLERHLEVEHALALQLERMTALRVAAEARDVTFGDAMQAWRKLDADDAAKRVGGGGEQRLALARAEIDEGEVLVARRQRAQAALEFLGLTAEIAHREQAIVPSHAE